MKNSINIRAAINIFIGSVCMLYLTYSCDLICDVDDIKPLYQLTEDAVFTDDLKTEGVLNGVYTAWKASDLNSFTAQTMMLSGNYEPATAGGAGTDLFENNVDVNNANLKNYYRDYYAVIQRSNYLIKAMQSDMEIPGLSSARRTEIEAEARLHRAMAHFFLLRNFGQFYNTSSELGIMISSEPLSGDYNIPRSGVQKCFDFVLEDLEYAMNKAPETATDGRLSRSAAKAMKAKILLYTQNWSDAADLCLQIISTGPYKLESDFRNLYTLGYKSKEVIFAPVSIYPNGILYAGSYTHKPGTLFKSVADKSVGTASDGNIQSGTGYDPRFAYSHAAASLSSGIYNNKYPFKNVSGQQAGSPFILRLGEIYLIYAEAKTRAGSGVDTSAVAKLNAIRERAGLPKLFPATKAELLENIRIEKQLELFGEFNEPWFDMVRYHILGDINISNIKSIITNNNQLILPYPILALSGNGGLLQNPGYPN
ncbi:MAG: RagB/SusD family nutrient uptake outer membrane protein [Prolixibacteraceae bacterium]|nr:RagB/SusD family nutrient uptake outer membrane protein [Prolixibacteraceae bacterium]